MSDVVGAIGAVVTIDGTPIEHIGDISGLELSTDEVEITAHDSPGAGEEKISTIKRWGQLAFPMFSEPSAGGQQALYAAWRDRTSNDYVVTYTDGKVATFAGRCIKFATGAGVTAANQMDVTISPDSEPAFEFGS